LKSSWLILIRSETTNKNFRVKGILKHYENNHYSDNNEITRAEIEAIEYLKAFKTVDETIYNIGNEIA
jgi:hypothetical protein